VTAAGQEVRTAVNICIDRMLDASEDPAHHRQMLASCTSSSATSTISGFHDDGRPFATMLLDGVTGGMGARAFADGPDTGGFLTSPAGACVNVEVSELNYPMRYLHRRERTDSGGPGRTRGGAGAENVYVPHRARGRFGVTVFAHGTEPPTSSGVAGGEPGMQNAFAIVRDGEWTRTAAKEVTHLDPADTFVNWCAGGGGIGDPLERPYDDVMRDIDDELVSAEGARRDYAVVPGDPVATTQLRHDRRRERLDGREPRPALAAPPPGGKRLSAAIERRADRLACRRCGADLGEATTPVKQLLVRHESTVGARWPWVDAGAGAARFVLRRFSCPGCAAQVDVEVNLVDAPLIVSMEVDR
jgi:N-methylhydantoinase B